MRPTLLLFVLCLSLCCGGARSVAAADRMVKIQLDGNSRVGSVIAHDQGIGWFLERDGRLDTIPLADVTDYEVLGGFRGYSSVELRERLAREFGRGYSVSSTGHYIVVSASGAEAGYGAVFEQLYRQFVVSFAARGFRMREPEFPLVAIVFPTVEPFLDYCRREGVQPQPGLRGYYLPSSNRVALYDYAGAGEAALGDIDSTILHEAVHQVAFNTGVHSRIGTNPLWLVEGLATAFEIEAVRSNNRSGVAGDRINSSRFRWLLQSRSQRPADAFQQLIVADDRFRESTLDAYAEAWGLTFYLLETRSAEFTSYLRVLSRRDPLQPYSPEERLRDFQQAFGRDVSLLATHLLRFYDDIAATTGGLDDGRLTSSGSN